MMLKIYIFKISNYFYLKEDLKFYVSYISFTSFGKTYKTKCLCGVFKTKIVKLNFVGCKWENNDSVNKSRTYLICFEFLHVNNL